MNLDTIKSTGDMFLKSQFFPVHIASSNAVRFFRSVAVSAVRNLHGFGKFSVTVWNTSRKR